MVCTVGPATETQELMEALIKEGMNVARLNFSHGDHEEHKKRIDNIKAARQATKKPVAIMLDTKGPEIRTGKLIEGKVELQEGNKIILTTQEVEGTAEKISVSYDGLAKDLTPGNTVLIDDGLIALTVEKIEGDDIYCIINNDGTLGSKKGVNIPNVSINLPGLTPKDESDLIFGAEQEIDFVAASFVRKPKDIMDIRKILDEHGGQEIQIIAKIENREGVDKIDRILAVADGIMVARGDLGVEIPAEEVPLVQKSIIYKCNLVGKPVITATQMLDSMIRNPRPTRAEVGDVANAVFDGTDAVMLSGETAAGAYPLEAARTMSDICEKIENSEEYKNRQKPEHGELTITNSVGEAVVQIAKSMNAAAIIAASSSGYTPRMLSKYRPECPILSVSNTMTTVRRLALSWGVYSLCNKEIESIDSIIADSVDAAKELGMISNGDLVVVAAGIPIGVQGNTNMIQVHTVGKTVLSGVGIGNEAVSGCAKLIDSNNIQDFNEGDILVVKSFQQDYMPALEKAAALVTEETGGNSEAARAAVKLDIPVVMGVFKAHELLIHGTIITVDPRNGMVFQGRIHKR